MQISNCTSYILGNNVPDSRKASEITLFTLQIQKFIEGIDNFCTSKRNEAEIVANSQYGYYVFIDNFCQISVSLVNIFLLSLNVAVLKLLV